MSGWIVFTKTEVLTNLAVVAENVRSLKSLSIGWQARKQSQITQQIKILCVFVTIFHSSNVIPSVTIISSSAVKACGSTGMLKLSV
jgi:hypothetical protein